MPGQPTTSVKAVANTDGLAWLSRDSSAELDLVRSSTTIAKVNQRARVTTAELLLFTLPNEFESPYRAWQEGTLPRPSDSI